MKKVIIAAIILIALVTPLRADWLDYPITADTFTGNGSLKWSVAFDNDTAISYAIRDGDTCIVSFVIFDSTVTGVGNALRVKLPPGVHPSRYIISIGKAAYDGQTVDVMMKVFDDQDFIAIEPWPGVFNKPDGNFVLMGQITFPVCYGSAPCSTTTPKRRAVR